jgi:hypothetical protein
MTTKRIATLGQNKHRNMDWLKNNNNKKVTFLNLNLGGAVPC